MNIIQIQKIEGDIMKSVDLEENELYRTICGKVRYNVYDGEKKSAADAATPEAQNVESCTNIKPRFNYIKKMFGCQGVIL